MHVGHRHVHAHQHVFQLLQQFGPARRLGAAAGTTRRALAGTGLHRAISDHLLAGTAFVGGGLHGAFNDRLAGTAFVGPLFHELHEFLAFLLMFLQRPVVEILRDFVPAFAKFAATTPCIRRRANAAAQECLPTFVHESEPTVPVFVLIVFFSSSVSTRFMAL